MRRLYTAILGVSFTLLLACSQPPKLNIEQAIAALKALNDNQSAQSLDTPWPFTEEYLQRRYEIYERIDKSMLSEDQLATLNYLVIEQRYVERYLPFTLNTVISPEPLRQSEPLQAQLAQWLLMVKDRLIEAAKSNIKLNRKEKEHLLSQLDVINDVNPIEPLSEASTSLENHLAGYRVRNALGMSQLPNGKEWYQVKINYYSGATHSPIQWITKISEHVSQHPQLIVGLAKLSDLLPLHSDSSALKDFDWRQQFMSYKASVAQKTLNDSDKALALVWMQIDLGIHSQLWNEELARQVMARAQMNPSQQDVMLAYVLAHPGQSLMYAQAVF